jgi:LuxR family quorum sensing-dependent transcriptional regulator
MAASCGASCDAPAGRTWDFYFNTWPTRWLAEYQRNNYVRYDLVPTIARLTAQPFTWREAVLGREQASEQVAFNQWIARLGIVDGFAVPLHYPGGDIGLCVSLADHPIEDVNEKRSLHFASIYAHERCRALGGLTETTSVKSLLTPREIECLRWVLKGKSDTDIGGILGISPNTVHFHVEKVKSKLGVKTRTQAATTIVTLGYL